MHEFDSNVSVVNVLARRMRMTEGQLYSAVIAVFIAALLALTGLPTAHKNVGGTTGASYPLPPTPTSQVAHR